MSVLEGSLLPSSAPNSSMALALHMALLLVAKAESRVAAGRVLGIFAIKDKKGIMKKAKMT